jgi:uncharacterized protein YjbI with pentapeptide repeats
MGQLRALVDSHQTARDLVLREANLRRVKLAGLRGDGLDLSDADLRESDLTGVRWKGCALRDARLDGADLTGAVLRMCDLNQARLTGATLTDAHLENSSAAGARFDEADLSGAILTDTDFSRASFRDANLEGVEATGADFRGADLRGAWLKNAQLTDADLRGADLTDAILDGADLRGANLTGAIMDQPVGPKEASQWDALPPELRGLAEMMTPVVMEALRTAGRSGIVDPEVVRRLSQDAARLPAPSPRNTPSPETLKAVARVVAQLEGGALPALLKSLQQPDGQEPPPEAKALISRLSAELALEETADAEDVLTALLEGLAGGRERPPTE